MSKTKYILSWFLLIFCFSCFLLTVKIAQDLERERRINEIRYQIKRDIESTIIKGTT